MLAKQRAIKQPTAHKQQQTSWPDEVDKLAQLERELCLQRHNAIRMRTQLVKEMLFNENFIDSNLRRLFAPASFKKPPSRRQVELKAEHSQKGIIMFERPALGDTRLLLDEQKEVELHINKSASLEMQLDSVNDRLRKLIDELQKGKQTRHSGFSRTLRCSFSEASSDSFDDS